MTYIYMNISYRYIHTKHKPYYFKHTVQQH